jgi:hypothetical protein
LKTVIISIDYEIAGLRWSHVELKDSEGNSQTLLLPLKILKQLEPACSKRQIPLSWFES